MKITIEIDPKKEPLLSEIYLGAPGMFEILKTISKLVGEIDRHTNPIWIADMICDSIRDTAHMSPHLSELLTQMMRDGSK